MAAAASRASLVLMNLALCMIIIIALIPRQSEQFADVPGNMPGGSQPPTLASFPAMSPDMGSLSEKQFIEEQERQSTIRQTSYIAKDFGSILKASQLKNPVAVPVPLNVDGDIRVDTKKARPGRTALQFENDAGNLKTQNMARITLGPSSLDIYGFGEGGARAAKTVTLYDHVNVPGQLSASKLIGSSVCFDANSCLNKTAVANVNAIPAIQNDIRNTNNMLNVRTQAIENSLNSFIRSQVSLLETKSTSSLNQAKTELNASVNSSIQGMQKSMNDSVTKLDARIKQLETASASAKMIAPVPAPAVAAPMPLAPPPKPPAPAPAPIPPPRLVVNSWGNWGRK